MQLYAFYSRLDKTLLFTEFKIKIFKIFVIKFWQNMLKKEARLIFLVKVY